jgi:hypothetical protein
MHAVVGIVGYYGFVRGYPLGPEFLERLRKRPWPAGAEIREMNWGPVAIVQDFQASGDKPDRVVLVGTCDRGQPAGSVRCRRWIGGALDPLKMQQRMFEAVTGVISLDNLLAVGEQFGIWPRGETYAVQLDWPESGLGDLVLGEASIDHARGHVVGEQPLTPDNERIVRTLVETVHSLALESSPGDLPTLSFDQLTPVARVAHHGFLDERGTRQ